MSLIKGEKLDTQSAAALFQRRRGREKPASSPIHFNNREGRRKKNKIREGGKREG